MTNADDDDPMNLTVEEFLREFSQIVELSVQGLPCSLWEDNSQRRNDEISRIGFTRQLAREELCRLKAHHRHKGPEADDNETRSCALYVFRYPIPGRPGLDAYVKVALKKHPSKRGIYVGKWYGFKLWGTGSDD
jgi:hypothetical protein